MTRFKELIDWLNDPQTADQVVAGKSKFLKTSKEGPITQLDTVGISNDVLKKKGREFYKENEKIEMSELLEGLNTLWFEPMLSEARILTTYILAKYHKNFDTSIWEYIDRWVESIDHWTSCDHLCMEITPYIKVYENPIYEDLQKWITSDNFWRRRFTIVSFLKHVRSDKSAVVVMLPLMNQIMSDNNYYVRKAIPWILREASKSDPEEVKEFIKERIELLTKTELREATDRLDPNIQTHFLKVYDQLKNK